MDQKRSVVSYFLATFRSTATPETAVSSALDVWKGMRSTTSGRLVQVDRATPAAEQAAQEERARQAASEAADVAVDMDCMEDAAVVVSAAFGLVKPGARGFIPGTEHLLLGNLRGIVVHEPPADVSESTHSPRKTAPSSESVRSFDLVSETEIDEVASKNRGRPDLDPKPKTLLDIACRTGP